jgi:hypothetical protein
MLVFFGFWPICSQTWPQNPSRATGLVLQCRLHQKSAQRTNSKANSLGGLWMLLKIYIYIYMFNSGPDPQNPQNRPGKAAPDPPDIVGLSREIVEFRSWSGGPVGHPQGVQSKTLNFQ